MSDWSNAIANDFWLYYDNSPQRHHLSECMAILLTNLAFYSPWHSVQCQSLCLKDSGIFLKAYLNSSSWFISKTTNSWSILCCLPDMFGHPLTGIPFSQSTQPGILFFLSNLKSGVTTSTSIPRTWPARNSLSIRLLEPMNCGSDLSLDKDM